MTKNLPDELYQLKSEHAKGAKLRANVILGLEDKTFSKTCFNILERQYENQTISELYTDDKKTKYSSTPNDILKLAKNLCEKLYTKRQMASCLTLLPLSKDLVTVVHSQCSYALLWLRYLMSIKTPPFS